MDVEVLDVERAPLGLLRVTIDRQGGVRVEDCEQASKQLSRVFEVENIDYKRLEVGSPGTDRPLKKVSDFLKYAGFRVEIKLREAVDSRKVFVGVLQVIDPAENPVFGLELETETKDTKKAKDAKTQPAQVLRFSFDDVDRAKLDPILDFKGNKR